MKHSKQYGIIAVMLMFFFCLIPLTAYLHFCIEFVLLDCCRFACGFLENGEREFVCVWVCEGVCFSFVVSATLLCHISKWELEC